MARSGVRNTVALISALFVFSILPTARANDDPAAIRKRIEALPILSYVAIALVEGELIRGTLAEVSSTEFAVWVLVDGSYVAVPRGGKLKRHIRYEQVLSLDTDDDAWSDVYDSASDFERGLRLQPYFFGGPAWFVDYGGFTMEFGGGADWLVYKGLGLGFDASIVSDGAAAIGTASANLSYHFLRDSPGIIPFVVGGIGAGSPAEFGLDGYTWVSAGGGFNYWFNNRMAFRLEVRARLDVDNDDHLVGARIGLTF